MNEEILAIFGLAEQYLEITEQIDKIRKPGWKNQALYTPLYNEMWGLIDQAKQLYKGIIKKWLIEHNIEAHIATEFRLQRPSKYRNYEVIFTGQTSMYNDKGSITKGTVRWLNKITVRGGNVITQVARTDEKFLGDIAEEFCEFVTNLQEKLRELKVKPE